jgi:protein phosphatase
MGVAVGAHIIALTDKGRRRQINQDRALAQEIEGGYSLLVVADGVGGSRGGEVASEETVQAFIASLWLEPVSDPAEALRTAAELANERVREVAREDTQLTGMATTLVAALVNDGHAWILSIGDSRAYLCHDATLKALTEDDSWVAEQVRSGALTEEEAERSPYQNVITRGIGVDDALGPAELVEHTLGSGDTLILCSDGLYRYVDEAAIVQTLGDGAQLSDMGQRLIDLANEAGGPDNISVALYRH